MNAHELKVKLLDWTIAHSGFEDRRYLGMSQIHACPRRLYFDLTDGRQWDADHHLACYGGYLHERDLKMRLLALGLYTRGSERELVAGWDARFRGHTDGECDGRLLEIKSVTQYKLDTIIADARLPEDTFQQAQCYLRYSAHPSAFVVFVARDTGRLHVHEVRAVPVVGERLENKARDILRALDASAPPKCLCRRCPP